MPAPSFALSQGVLLALGGGAALGWAHIGVIRALQERGARIEGVAGTSIGAVVAASLASGQLDALEQLAREHSHRHTFRYLDVSFGGGMIGGRLIERELERHLGQLRLEELAMPCAIVAADLVSGGTIVLRHGPVAEAVRASVAIPGLFRPVVRGDHVLADGGLVAPVPVEEARALGAAPVIAVSLYHDYARRAAAAGFGPPVNPRRVSTIGVARLSLGLLLARFDDALMALHRPDAIVAPLVGDAEVADFTRADSLIAAGHAAVAAVWPA